MMVTARSSSLIILALSEAHAALDGVYRDPRHAQRNSLAGLRALALAQESLTIVGTQDGSAFFHLEGTATKEGVIEVDFSPLGGGKLSATCNATTIAWADGNVWELFEEPAFDLEAQKHSGIGGVWADSKYRAGSFRGTRFLYAGDAGAVTIVGTDNGASFFAAQGTLTDDTLVLKENEAASLPVGTANYTMGRLEWAESSTVWTLQRVVPNVPVTIFGQALSEETREFMGKTLADTMLLDAEVMSVTYVPFGNAWYETQQCGGLPNPPNCTSPETCLFNASVSECFDRECGARPDAHDGRDPFCFLEENAQCENGPAECFAHRVQACAGLHDGSANCPRTALDPLVHVRLVQCMFKPPQHVQRLEPPLNRTAVLALAEACAEEVGALWKDIECCVESKLDGDRATAKGAELMPVHAQLPHVVVDGTALEGVPLSTAQLVDAVCAALPAARRLPAACAALISPPPPAQPPPLAPPPKKRRSSWMSWFFSLIAAGATAAAGVYAWRHFLRRRVFAAVGYEEEGVAVPLAAAAEYVAH